MDPAAIKELQRLYKKKYKPAETHNKRLRLSGDDHSTASTTNDIADVESNNSFTAFTDEGQDRDDVEVIAFDEKRILDPDVAASQGFKSFMSGKVPRQTILQARAKQKDSDDSEDDLKKDKELQRLLRDSHLLVEQGGTALETTGKIRQKSISARLIANGASAPKAQKMPISMRKGIEAAVKGRKAAEDRYIRESGIVTARPTAQKAIKKKNKTLHELNLGSYKNGQLRITRAEINRINGPSSTKKGKKRSFRTFNNIG